MFRVPSGTTGARLPPAAVGLALAPVLIVLIATLAPVAVRDARLAPRSEFADCLAITESQGRLTCYDALAKEKQPMPAKGGEPILPSG
jgi:hypothetical protein